MEFDQEIVDACLDAGRDLGIRVTAAYLIRLEDGQDLLCEAYFPDFGGTPGTAVGNCDAAQFWHRRLPDGSGYSHLNSAFAPHFMELYMEPLDDWGWSGEAGEEPHWYTGERGDGGSASSVRCIA